MTTPALATGGTEHLGLGKRSRDETAALFEHCYTGWSRGMNVTQANGVFSGLWCHGNRQDHGQIFLGTELHFVNQKLLFGGPGTPSKDARILDAFNRT